MTRKLDDMIELPKSQPKRAYNEDLECEIVMVKMPKCMAWLDDEPIGDLDTMEDKAKNPSPQSTPQALPSFGVYTPPVTHPKDVEETIMEVEPLNHMKLEDLGLGTNTHELFLSSKGLPSVDEPEPQLLPKRESKGQGDVGFESLKDFAQLRFLDIGARVSVFKFEALFPAFCE
ncbi:hypothetical protein Tco_1066544 [Tanacetum coccineum]|uniref:Uncharacterized protein n=1 Tax=Tanacetum coccineum TaxID=301880 RepID=A0ABQ5HAB8_9ASTR